MRAQSAAAALLAAALLAACASIAVAPRDPQPFDLVGRVLVTYDAGALTANLRWEHSGEQDQIWLMTPTGQTLAYIVASDAGATLTRADQQQYRARSVEALTRQALGWALPLGQLQYWVRGLPAPGSAFPQIERGIDDRLATISQDGWQIALTYYTDEENRGRVRRLDLKNATNEIRLVVDTWRDGNAQ